LDIYGEQLVDCIWNVMAHAQKPDFVFWRNGWVHLNRQERQFIRLLAAKVCASAVVMVVMLDTLCSEIVWRVMATHTIRQFLLHFSSRASPCAITFQLDCVYVMMTGMPVHMEQLVSRRTGLKLSLWCRSMVCCLKTTKSPRVPNCIWICWLIQAWIVEYNPCGTCGIPVILLWRAKGLIQHFYWRDL